MKKRKLFFSFLGVALMIGFSGVQVSSASSVLSQPRSGTIKSGEEFGGSPDSTKFMKVPGGHLHGKATLQTINDDGSLTEVKYDSEKAEETITLKELKQQKLKEKELIQKELIQKELNGNIILDSIKSGEEYDNPITNMKYDSDNSQATMNLRELNNNKGSKPATKVYNLDLGEEYISDYFSAKGWRFAGYLFKAVNSPEPYLRWESHGDSAVLGTRKQALDTLESGLGIGELLYSNSYLYTAGTKTYYTHSPIQYTFYYVGNV